MLSGPAKPRAWPNKWLPVRINTVVLFVGANDFAIWNNTYANIYNGVLAGQSLKDYIDKIVSSIATAIDTVRTTEAVNIIVTNLHGSRPGCWFYCPLS